MIRLIVNGDDLGIAPEVNDGILKAHQEGILTSASIMATGAYFDHACALCKRTPTLDVGVHLSLVETRSILPKQEVRSLLNGDTFHPTAAAFTKEYLLRRLSAAEIYRELDAQIARVLDAGISVTHLDSHQHVHLLPGILDVTVRLASRYGVPAVRIPDERYRLPMVRGVTLKRLLELLPLSLLSRLGRHKVATTTDHFAGFLYGGRLDLRNLQRVLAHLPQTGVIELMTHPALAGPRSPHGRWGYHGEAELEALTHPAVLRRVHGGKIQLCSFGALAKAPRSAQLL